jgi:hypothetical protein
MDFDIEFVFSDARFRPSVVHIVDDLLKNKLKYQLPYLVDQHLNGKLAGNIEAYLMNHQKTKSIFSVFNQKIEDATKKKLASITNEDPYQNAVFGPFMKNLERRCNNVLQKTKDDLKNDISRLKTGQNFLLGAVGLLGAYSLGATWYMVNQQK